VDADGESLFGHFIEDDSVPTPYEHTEEQMRKEALEALLDNLDPRLREVLQLRFGLNNKDPKSLEQIGEKYGVTRERVRQLEGEALKKLKELAPRYGLSSEID
jgi:RNA polymerase primary sigma factor